MTIAISSFTPAPALDLSSLHERASLNEALTSARTWLATYKTQPTRVAPSGREIPVHNPSDGAETLGSYNFSAPEQLDAALERAWQTFSSWRETTPEERIALLQRVASLMRAERRELAATVLLETGKVWAEADGEVAESIDFLEYHQQVYKAMLNRAESAVLPHPRERNEYRYVPLGVGVLLPPWPFPIAQLTAMVSAAVVTGNAVVVKPAPWASLTSARVIDLWRRAGAPTGLIELVFGTGADVGRYLTRHRRTRFVVLTGSSATGSAVTADLASSAEQRPWFTRLSMELSGKNPVVVDATADLELTAKAIAEGAFSFSGQKCSAGTRAIVVADVYDEFLERMVAQAEAMTVANPAGFETGTGPLINDSAAERHRRAVASAKQEGCRVHAGGTSPAGPNYVRPTVIEDVAMSSPLARTEWLTPILTVTSAKNVEAALQLANDSPYGLTGSFFSSTERHVELAARTMMVGSLYLNRKPTASEVGFHPFGGFGLSGTDAKAGGPDYLFNYVQPQLVTRAK